MPAKFHLEVDTPDYVVGSDAGFEAPAPPSNLSFTLDELAAAIARANALSNASVEVIQALSSGVLAMLDVFVVAGQGEFALSTAVAVLADSRRTAFSADLGAGIAHLYMLELKYAFCCNAKEWISKGHPPDMLYAAGSNYPGKLVAAEAKASIHSRVSPTSLLKTVSKGFADQVYPHLPGGELPNDCVLHGYCIGIGAKPGHSAFTKVLESTPGVGPIGGIDDPAVPGSPGPEGDSVDVPWQVAVDDLRASLALMGAVDQVRRLDSWHPALNIDSDAVQSELSVVDWNGRDTYVSQQPYAGPSLFGICEAPRAAFGLDAEMANAFLLALGAVKHEQGLVRLPLVAELRRAQSRNLEAGARFPNGLVYFGRDGVPDKAVRPERPTEWFNDTFEKVPDVQADYGESEAWSGLKG